MVELKLNTADWQSYVKDHYISVRVGEVQKLAKLAASRTYKFPKDVVNSRKYGKVELFRRVGQAVVCIDPKMASGVNEVEVAFDEAGKSLKFDAEVFRFGAKPSSPKKAAATPNKVAAYLDEHHLEARLSDAMQAVLREQPADPAAFLADLLTKNGSIVAKLPKRPPTEDANKLDSEPAAHQAAPVESEQANPVGLNTVEQNLDRAASLPGPPVEATECRPAEVSKPALPPKFAQAEAAEMLEHSEASEKVPKSSMIPAQDASLAKAVPPPEVLPFRQYYAKHFAGHSEPQAFDRLYHKFPAAASAPLMCAEVAQESASNRERTVKAADLEPPAASGILPFEQYYSTHFGSHISADSKLYDKFTSAQTVAEATKLPLQAEVSTEAPASIPESAASVRSARLLPSSGSFHTGVSCYGGLLRHSIHSDLASTASLPVEDQVHKVAESEPVVSSPPARPLFLPSTGSFLGASSRSGGLLRHPPKRSSSQRLSKKSSHRQETSPRQSSATTNSATSVPAIPLLRRTLSAGSFVTAPLVQQTPKLVTSLPTSESPLASGKPPAFLPSMGSFQGGVSRNGGLIRHVTLAEVQIQAEAPQAAQEEAQVTSSVKEPASEPLTQAGKPRFLPSVGSFLGGTSFGGVLIHAPRRSSSQPIASPRRDQAVFRTGPLEAAAAVMPVKQQVSVTPTPAPANPPANAGFSYMPSVGTWLVRPVGVKACSTATKAPRPTSGVRRRRPASSKVGSQEEVSQPPVASPERRRRNPMSRTPSATSLVA